MSREIKAPEVIIAVAKSFDGKHELEFNEKSHRYKWICKCHLKAGSCGVTTFLKASYPTSMGLIKWMQDQALKFLFNELTIQSDHALEHRFKAEVIAEDKRIDLFKQAKIAHEDIAREAADIGTVCHAYAELHSLGKYADVETLVQSVKGVEKWPLIDACITKYLEWSNQNQGELVMAEGLIASPTYLYCGKFDRLDKINGKLRLRDYKTSKDIYLDQFIQLGAYAIAIKEWLGLDVEEFEVLRFGKDDGAFQTLLINNPKEIQIFKDQAIRCRETYEFTKLNNDPRFDWKKK